MALSRTLEAKEFPGGRLAPRNFFGKSIVAGCSMSHQNPIVVVEDGGFDVLKWIRSEPGLKPLRVAMLSSSDLDQEIKQAYELGANSFLTKVNLVKSIRPRMVKKESNPGAGRSPNAATGGSI